jgi:hypothetical protein
MANAQGLQAATSTRIVSKRCFQRGQPEIVVTHLTRALEAGTTNRIRLMETYADPKSYYLDGDELVWDRSFGRLRNTVVLPLGWCLTALASPATIETLPDGRVSVYVVNPRNDDVRVYLRARRRPA